LASRDFFSFSLFINTDVSFISLTAEARAAPRDLSQTRRRPRDTGRDPRCTGNIDAPSRVLILTTL